MSGTIAAPVTPSPVDDAAERLRPVSMEEAVGYAGIDCAHERLAEHSLVLKHDRLFMLVDPHGNIAPAGLCSLGLFQDDTRILSHYALSVHGGPPDLLSAQVPSAFGAQIDLAVSNLSFGGDRWDPRNVVHIRRELAARRPAGRAGHAQRLPRHAGALLGRPRARLRLRRHLRGARMATARARAVLRARADGRRAGIRLSGPRRAAAADAWCVSAGRPTGSPSGAPGGICGSRCERQVELEWEVYADEGGDRRVFPAAAWTTAATPWTTSTASWHEGNSRWETDVDDFDALLHRAADDLRALYVEVDGEKVISAGIPWYSTVFGRDSVITSLQALPLQPQIAIDTLRYLARRQGRREDPYTEEQPGKILHELRRGEMARSGEIPHVPYYGSIDATPLWLILLHETWRWTGDTALVRELLPNAERALEWIDRFGDQDGDGFVEYSRTSEKGLVEPGLEGFGQRGAVSRRPAARAADRAGRGSGLRVRRQAADGRAVPACGTDGARGDAPARGGRAQEPDPLRVLDREARHLRARARRSRSARSPPPPPTPGTCSGAGCRRRRSLAGSPPASSSPTSSPAGACAR